MFPPRSTQLSVSGNNPYPKPTVYRMTMYNKYGARCSLAGPVAELFVTSSPSHKVVEEESATQTFQRKQPQRGVRLRPLFAGAKRRLPAAKGKYSVSRGESCSSPEPKTVLVLRETKDEAPAGLGLLLRKKTQLNIQVPCVSMYYKRQSN